MTYYQTNKDKILEYQKEYNDINRDKIKEYQKEYHKMNYIPKNKPIIKPEIIIEPMNELEQKILDDKLEKKKLKDEINRIKNEKKLIRLKKKEKQLEKQKLKQLKKQISTTSSYIETENEFIVNWD